MRFHFTVRLMWPDASEMARRTVEVTTTGQNLREPEPPLPNDAVVRLVEAVSRSHDNSSRVECGGRRSEFQFL